MKDTVPMTALHNALPDPEAYPQFYDGVPVKRGLAWVFDVVLIALLSVVLLPFTVFTAIFYFPAFMLVVGFLYRWVTLANRGATWGMRLMGVEIRDADGGAMSSPQAFLHVLGYSISIAVFPLALISAGLMLTTARGQGLTDHVLGTVALNR